MFPSKYFQLSPRDQTFTNDVRESLCPQKRPLKFLGFFQDPLNSFKKFQQPLEFAPNPRFYENIEAQNAGKLRTNFSETCGDCLALSFLRLSSILIFDNFEPRCSYKMFHIKERKNFLDSSNHFLDLPGFYLDDNSSRIATIKYTHTFTYTHSHTYTNSYRQTTDTEKHRHTHTHI